MIERDHALPTTGPSDDTTEGLGGSSGEGMSYGAPVSHREHTEGDDPSPIPPSSEHGGNGENRENPLHDAIAPKGRESTGIPVDRTPDRTQTQSDRVRQVVAEVTSRPTRDAVTGRFLAGSLGGRTGTLARSEVLLEALEPMKRDVVARALADRGLNGDVVQTLGGVIDAYAEIHLLRQSMWIRMIESGGPITGKGKKRALFTAYLGALDRETKLAQIIGLERGTKRIDLARVLSGIE